MLISSFPTGISSDDQTITAVKSVNVTLMAAGWAGASAPYTQTVNVDFLMIEDQEGDLVIAKTATAAQREAQRSARLRVTGQTTSTITVAADAEKPTVDIPCELRLYLTEGGDFAGDFAQRWELAEHEEDTDNPHGVTAAQVGAIPTSQKGVAGGVEKQIGVETISFSTQWSGNGPFSQAISVAGATATSKIDLQLGAAALQQLLSDGVSALWVENNDGVTTAYTIGGAPTAAFNAQVTITEVVA